MASWWTLTLVAGRMPELHETPVYAWFHLTVEYLTALILIVGAYGLQTGRTWGLKTHLVSLGMLLYAVIQAAGYYAQMGQMSMVLMFGTIFIMTSFFFIQSLRLEVV
jgi:hypothetical protein